MSAEALLGTWSLVSLYLESSAGDVVHQYGEDPFGLLTYNANGTMSAVLMRRRRRHFAKGFFEPAPDELAEAFAGFDAYAGTYSVDEGGRVVTHHVEGSRLPGWEGQDLVRYFELDGDTLRLRSEPIVFHDKTFVVFADWTRRL
jgi:hypothetical protein